MNQLISWDPSLVKKFSSSSHFKLLNQLRKEVIKYPLNNKKRTSYIDSKDNNLDVKNKLNVSQKQNISFSNNFNDSGEAYSNKSTVSFNNAKNFSIYNNNNISRENEQISDHRNPIDDSSSPNFSERLNKKDMK